MDVYNHRFLCRFRQQNLFPIESAVCSEIFAVLKLVNGMLNICTKTSLQLGNLKHIFWIEFATEWFFSQKLLLLANVKLTLQCCDCAVRAQPRKQYLISIVIEFESVDVNFLSSEILFRRFFLRWCQIYVQLFSNVFFRLAEDFTSNIEVRSQGNNHFCYKLHKVRHFEKNFVSEAVWDLCYCIITWFWAPRLVQQMIGSTEFALLGVSLQKCTNFSTLLFWIVGPELIYFPIWVVNSDL